MPAVTVLMPVYNGEYFLAEAINSVLGQTLPDFELLIIDDGSTDGSDRIIRSYTDTRIRYVRNDVNRGLVFTLNRGLDLAQGRYIARMDCDDICHPRRLQLQVGFMDSNPAVGVCGTWYRELRGRISTIMRCAVDHDAIRCGNLFNPVIGHPTAMLRHELLDRYQLRYDAAFAHAEDYRLWSVCLDHCAFANMDTVLMSYRVHSRQLTQSKLAEQMEAAGRVRRMLLDDLGLEPTDEEFQVHQFLSALGRPYRNSLCDHPLAEQLASIDRWLCALKEANAVSRTFPEPAFTTMLVERWLGVIFLQYICRGNIGLSLLMLPRIIRETDGGEKIAREFMKKRARYMVGDVLDNFRIKR